MLKLEDYHSGRTEAVIPYDLETLVEGHLRNVPKENDLRDYSYESTVLRPRHIVALHETLRPYEHKIFLTTGPVFVFDGQQGVIKTTRTDTFVDLLKLLEDLCQTNSRVFLYSVSRATMVDPNTFDSTVAYLVRYAE